MTRPEEKPCPNSFCAGILETELNIEEDFCSSCGYTDGMLPPEGLSEDRQDQAE